ncbi:GNAT family N-acetyltransferase [Shewanella sp. Isolate11]|uniref:GNAT family N-acetyltransferase n=1 Tax=Shewanella sp. Isolate11 TaxID=2908530 RepID=UPI001EFE46CD|nr:GNAT family N-acetyltransferase [Shewanella sp. Isolate11]MCG9696064.1 GNAT family N-acetyltransferase [Shewanella sp. Isolate11]
MFSIRKAVKKDAAKIYAIRCRAILAECSGFYSDKQLALWTEGDYSSHFAEDVTDNFYVTEKQSKVIGSGKLDLDTGVIDAIFVDPDYFDQGAAKLMLAFLEQLALKNGLSILRLDSTLNAAAFYRSQGFIGNSISSYHSPRGICLDCIPMQKALLLAD